jgi:hypothetical protein
MLKTLLFLLGSCCLLSAQDMPSTTPGKLLWRASLAALATANTLDVQSSWGKHELNPALAAPGATFGRENALIKLGMVGTLVGVEFLITRHRPSARLYRALGVINFGAAAAVGGTAIHNYTVANSTK